ncbi:MAG: tetratricopeptide repeat protein [Planctomycetota bacterium]
MVDFTKHLQKAEEAVRRRNYDFAVELYRQLLDLDPDQGDARAGLRQALHLRHQTKGGGKLLRSLRGAAPLSKAHGMLKLKRFDAAARALEDYLKSNPVDVEANLLLGESLEAAGHQRSARAVYEFVAEIDPKNGQGLKRAGAMFQATGDFAKALEYYERALAADPRDQEVLKARKDLAAETALAGGGLDAVAHSRERMANPEETRALERQRRTHLSEDELREDLARAEERFHQEPSDPDRMVALAAAHERLKDSETALDLIERALQYRKGDSELEAKAGDLRSAVLRRRLAAAGKSGDEAGADRIERELSEHELAELRRRVAARPGDGGLRLALAQRLFRDEDFDGALAELQQAQGDPRLRREVSELKGGCFRAKGFGDLAAKELEKALEGLADTDERAKSILYTLGLLAEEEGDRDTARSRFARVYEVDIGFRDVSQKMEALR